MTVASLDPIVRPAGTPAAAADTRPAAAVAWDQRFFAHAVAPWLTPATRVLEIGAGTGVWTVRLAPLVHHLDAVDVSAEMVEATRARVRAAGLDNVTCVAADARRLAHIADGSIDVVFSFNVFVHVPLEEMCAFVGEIGRVLADGGRAVVHHAIGDVRPAWDHIEAGEAAGAGPLGDRYRFHSRDAIEALYAQVGLRIEASWTDGCTTVVLAVRPADSVVPRLEQALRQAAAARTPDALAAAAADLTAASQDLQQRLPALLAALEASPPGAVRFRVIQRIRRLFRG